MNRKDIGALVYLPEDKKIETYSAENLEAFTTIEDYWMKREGLVFYPFDRTKQAFFFGKEKINLLPAFNTLSNVMEPLWSVAYS